MGHEPFPVHVDDVELPFRCVDAGAEPGRAVASEFARSWPAYRRWYLHEGEHARPSYAACRDAVRTHLPELAGDFSMLVDAVGGGDLEARFLSHWCPPPLVAACSIAMLGAPTPVLLRNYDYPPILCDALALRTHWSNRSVIGMSDCGWGLMDGVNDAGLAVSISFGGRREVGVGFGIGLIVRTLLQVATTTAEAVERLVRIPVQMSYNVAIVDSIGDRRVVHIAPDRPARISYDITVANRQGATEWPEHAEYCNSVEREQVLAAITSVPFATTDGIVAAFLVPPLHRSLLDSTWGTVYTAQYEPVTGTMTLLWPDDRWCLSVHGSGEGSRPRHTRALVPDPVPVRTEVPRQEGTLFLL